MKSFIVVEEAQAEEEKAAAPVRLMVRPFDLEDKRFVEDSWIRSYKEFEPLTDDEDYRNGQRAVIMSLSSHAQVLVMCDEAQPRFLLSYLCYDKIDKAMLIHYLYTKHPYRRMGLGKALLAAAGWKTGQQLYASHKTRASGQLAEPYNIHYNQYYLRCGTYEKLKEAIAEKETASVSKEEL